LQNKLLFKYIYKAHINPNQNVPDTTAKFARFEYMVWRIIVTH